MKFKDFIEDHRFYPEKNYFSACSFIYLEMNLNFPFYEDVSCPSNIRIQIVVRFSYIVN